MNIEDKFFKDEIRSGYHVSEMMKRTWASQLTILQEIEKLCDKYGLKYYADAGTLLGAVRHKGFIPWDDDVDIVMLREEYDVLLKHSDEIADGLCIRSIYNSDTFFNFHAVATHNAQTLTMDADRMRQYCGCPFICGVDIFPLDYYYCDPDKFKVFKLLFSFGYKLVYDCVAYENGYNNGELVCYKELSSAEGAGELLKNLDEYKCYIEQYAAGTEWINENKPLRNQLCRLTDRMAGRCHSKMADRVGYAAGLSQGSYCARKKEFYNEQIELPFEMIQIKAPGDYAGVLTAVFGSGYMTPIRGGTAHDFPFYKQEINVLVGGDIGERYIYVPSRKYLKETFDVLHEAENQVDALVMRDEISNALDVLADMQNLAVRSGDYSEDAWGEGNCIVKSLEEYCEAIYDAYSLLSGNSLAVFQKSEEMQRIWVDTVKTIRTSLLKARKSLFIQDHAAYPDGWESDKKGVIIGISAAGVVNNTYPELERVRALIKELTSKEGMFILLFASAGLKEFLDRTDLDVKVSYIDFLKEMKLNEKLTVIEDPSSEEIDASLALCSEYYGDGCRLADLCRDAGMEVHEIDYNVAGQISDYINEIH